MYLLEGQTRPTVIEWEPLEASIVDIGGDAEAVRFGLTGRGEDPLSILPLLNKNNNIDMDKVKMIALLGLAADATDADIEAKVAALNLSAATAKSILVQAALSLAKTKGLTAEKEAAFALMAESSPEMVIAMLNLLPTATPQSVPTPTPTTQTLAAALTTASLNQKPAPATGREAWTLTDWRKQDPNGLLALEKTNEGAFLALVEQSMKFKPQ